MGGQSVAFEFRTQDARLGRFLSTDPLTATTPWETPYAFANNSPILKIDFLGLSGEKPKKKKRGGFLAKLFGPKRNKQRKFGSKKGGTADADGNFHAGNLPVAVKEYKLTANDKRTIRRNKRKRERTANLATLKEVLESRASSVSVHRDNGWAKMSKGNIAQRIVYGAANTFYAGPQVFFTPTVQNLDNTLSTTPDERFEAAASLAAEAVPVGKGVSIVAKPIIKAVQPTLKVVQSTVVKAVAKRVAVQTAKLGCFVGGTIVITPDSSKVIDSIRLGELVAVSFEHTEDPLFYNLLASKEELEEARSTSIIQKDWKRLQLEMLKPSGDRTLIELLRPQSWIKENLKVEHNEIYISLPEMGSVGYFKVLSIDSCTITLPDSGSSYRPVIGKFIHISNMVWELTFEGMNTPLGVTSNHPIWSYDRQRWVDAGDLKIDELVTTQNGVAKLLSKQYLEGEHKVYNIEVHDAHNYFVSDLAILVHNTCPWENVVKYLTEHGILPNNFITKAEARVLGWNPRRGNLHDVAPGKSIGGDRFGNREGLLPSAPGRQWYEADINYTGGRRNSERLLFSNDGLFYKTTDHYGTFTPIILE